MRFEESPKSSGRSRTYGSKTRLAHLCVQNKKVAIIAIFRFVFSVFPEILLMENYRFHVFLRNCPPRRDLTVGRTSLYFFENAHVLDLTVGRTSSLFDRHLEAFWGAADLSIVYAFLLFTHETNMFVKPPKYGTYRKAPLRGDPR